MVKSILYRLRAGVSSQTHPAAAALPGPASGRRVERMEQLCAIQRAGPEKLLEIRSIGEKSLPLIAAVCARYEENKTPSQGGALLL